MSQRLSEKSLVSSEFPTQMGISEIVLHDDSESSDVLDVEEYSYTNRECVNLENAAVNIDNSNDVIIGPVTQFNVNGNVTIYQNGNRQSPEAINDTISQNEPDETKFANGGKKRKPSNILVDAICMKNSSLLKRLFILGTLVLILLFFVGVLLTILDDDNYEIEDYDDEFKDHEYGDHLGNHKILYRNDWGGSRPRKNTTLIKHPSSLIIISHSTTRFCDTFDSCSKIIKHIQKRHMSRPISKVDIGYNFIIGGNGDIYVGRGWDIRNFHRKESIDIDFIGDYAFDELTQSMINATKLLIDQGIQLNKLSKDYVIVGENQTNSKMYLSPGENVYKIIKDWPHFFNHTMF